MPAALLYQLRYQSVSLGNLGGRPMRDHPRLLKTNLTRGLLTPGGNDARDLSMPGIAFEINLNPQ
jgi:hypothetical protein